MGMLVLRYLARRLLAMGATVTGRRRPNDSGQEGGWTVGGCRGSSCGRLWDSRRKTHTSAFQRMELGDSSGKPLSEACRLILWRWGDERGFTRTLLLFEQNGFLRKRFGSIDFDKRDLLRIG